MNQYVIDGWGAFPYTNLTGYFGDRKNKSFSFSIIPKYLVRDDVRLRCEFGFTNIHLISHFNGINDSGATGIQTNLIKDDTIQQKIFRLTPGIQWNFVKRKFLQAYCGFSANYQYYGKSYWKDNLKSNDSPDFDRWTGVTPGGFAAGIGAFAGFNIYLLKRISIGSELSSSLVYYKLGGVQTGMRYAGPNLSTYPRAWSIANNVASGIQFCTIMPSINVVFLF